MMGEPIQIADFETATLGLLVFLIGARITRAVRFLRDFNIPEPVTGGLLAALMTLGIYVWLGRPVSFGLQIRDYLLVLFFSGIGLNARLRDVASGGRPLAILLGLTVALILLQNLLGAAAALAFGLPAQLGVLLGSASLIGGHGTTIAWSPEIGRITGFSGAMELGIASATLGLVIAAVLGGPLARFLIERKGLTPAHPDDGNALGLNYRDEAATSITPESLMRTLFVLHVVILIGLALHDLIGMTGLKLPAFVPCMLVAIAIGNLLPVALPRYPAVSRTPALALVSEVALGTFLAISLMSMQLWTLQGLGLLMLVSLALQTVMVVAFILFVLFRLMGGEYRAAVLSAGFMGFALGATPTAIANMNAVTKRYGPSPVAFVILPLVSAFFVDLANAAVIQLFLAF
jgi:ESS family glutamate:Na+ symporter